MQRDSIVGLKIAYYRKLCGLTQEELAEKVGVSCQAVSKWEQQTSCPDIFLLPILAEIFNISIDELFGINLDKETVYSLLANLPWPDDEKVRVALYQGAKLIDQSDYECTEGVNIINIQFHGVPFNINGVCNFVYSKQRD
ncbi:helix-turn-helix transcriptional regulator [Clostridium sp.]|uniref:helix-turn-helix transcriptional regulator n=1 Tax=Clostridium sp. TaxID=1506 RepID=UPI003F394561